MSDELKLSKKESSRLRDIVLIREAFKMGMDWAETYASRFTPTEEDTNKHLQAAIDKLLSD